MESMRENRALLYSLVSTGSFIVLLALGWSPDLCEQFGIVNFPDEVRTHIAPTFPAGSRYWGHTTKYAKDTDPLRPSKGSHGPFLKYF